VNFAFLVAALRKLGVWDQVSAARGEPDGKTLAETRSVVAEQATKPAALADVAPGPRALTGLVHEYEPGAWTQVEHKRRHGPEYSSRLDRASADVLAVRSSGAPARGKARPGVRHLPWKTIPEPPRCRGGR